jgi:hypothetical protein
MDTFDKLYKKLLEKGYIQFPKKQREVGSHFIIEALNHDPTIDLTSVYGAGKVSYHLRARQFKLSKEGLRVHPKLRKEKLTPLEWRQKHGFSISDNYKLFKLCSIDTSSL